MYVKVACKLSSLTKVPTINSDLTNRMLEFWKNSCDFHVQEVVTYDRWTHRRLICIICVVLQGRQKLALFNAKEFATLIIDILNDARRREQGSNPDLTQGM